MDVLNSFQSSDWAVIIAAAIGVIGVVAAAVITGLFGLCKKKPSKKRNKGITINQRGSENATIIGIQNNYSEGDKHG